MRRGFVVIVGSLDRADPEHLRKELSYLERKKEVGTVLYRTVYGV